jgi:hypothetical protein
MSLRSGEAIQPPRLCFVFWSVKSIAMHGPELVLRPSIPLRSREAMHPPRLHINFRSANPLRVLA